MTHLKIIGKFATTFVLIGARLWRQHLEMLRRFSEARRERARRAQHIPQQTSSLQCEGDWRVCRRRSCDWSACGAEARVRLLAVP